MDTHAPLVVVRTFGTTIDAHLAHSALEAAGIDSMIRPDDCGGTKPSLEQTAGVDVLVRQEDASEAERILTADLR
jgi:hypothetical protein